MLRKREEMKEWQIEAMEGAKPAEEPVKAPTPSAKTVTIKVDQKGTVSADENVKFENTSVTTKADDGLVTPTAEEPKKTTAKKTTTKSTSAKKTTAKK